MGRQKIPKICNWAPPIGFGLPLGVVTASLFFWVGHTANSIFINFVNESIISIPQVRSFINTLGLSDLLVDNKLATTHGNTFQFMVGLFLIHWLSGQLLKPDWRGRPIKSSPTMMYALLLLSWIVLLLGIISFWLDAYRFPTILFIALFAIVAYQIAYRLTKQETYDYFFKIKLEERIHSDSPKEELALSEYWLEGLKKKFSQQKDSQAKTLVVVCAAGGGIQAAAWTARVLTGLSEHIPTFENSLGLISSVSGGSVGNMFYLEDLIARSDGAQPVQKPGQNSVVESASKDSLDATGWGLAHADFWRFIGLGGLVIRDVFRDRGWAIEQNWQESFVRNSKTTASGQPLTAANLHAWRDKVIDGTIPLPIFNSTLIENGERLLISPLPMNFENIYWDESFNSTQSTDIYNLYGCKTRDVNMDITTAARLSATFPYVSPVCRAADESNSGIKLEKFHLGDGGYFDNFGVYSALEWLNSQNLNEKPVLDTIGIEKIVLIKILSFPRGETTPEKGNKNGWLTSLIGPLQAVISVRTTSQEVAADMACEAFEQQVSSEHFDYLTIEYPPNLEYKPPLSWKLSDKEIIKIYQAWSEIKLEAIDTVKRAIGYQ